ncbi:MAG TPA: zf-TFIIB domain-containing protein [Pyrinomonadaceae bacterium]|nr:zf-TFIIB domain-containing protein [Acidobacteriota bacterium]HQZ96362.1 zf-TFIIB domain-containing protein [Pyrinomonadaceae bacterium]
MTVEALNCPNCGAGVQSDRPQCEFCKTRLKTVGCPSCFGLMFVGTKFCGHCGAIAAPIEVGLDETSGDCPRCRRDLEPLQIGETELRGCTKCDGLWLDAVTFETICADRERQSAVLGFLDERRAISQPQTKVSYVPCPDCGQLMNRSNFAKASGVIVDICKKHGIWFDADELPAIIEFVQKGGMEIARQRERNELEQERERLRDEQRRLAMQANRTGLSGFLEDPANSGTRTFVRRLFDI